MPKDWKIHSCDVDWTERYHGSCGALKAAAQNEEVIVPPGGVYIRSKRMNTYYRVTCEEPKLVLKRKKVKRKDRRKKTERKSSRSHRHKNYLRQSLPIIKAAENYFDLLKTALHEASLKDTVQSEKAISAKQLHSPRALADQRNGDISQWAHSIIDAGTQIQNSRKGRYHPWDAGSAFLQLAIQRWQRGEMPLDLHEAKIHAYMDKSTMILKPAREQWSEAQFADAKLYANTARFMCHRLGGKPLHMLLVGPSASGKTFSQSALLQQLLPEASIGGRSEEPLRGTPHEQPLHNPVVFISIDGENVREVERVDDDAPYDVIKIAEKLATCSKKFKSTLRTTLQRMGFNTVEPTVHIKRMRKSISHMIRVNAASASQSSLFRVAGVSPLPATPEDDDSDSDESMHETFPPRSPFSPRSPRSMKGPRRSAHTMKRLRSKKLMRSPKRSNSGRSRNSDQIKFSLLSVTWQNRVAGGSWEYYSPENSNLLTAAYRNGSKTVDLGRWMVDLRLMSQKSKDEHEFGQVRALNHRGNPLPRLDARAIGAMQELEQMQRDDEQQVFRPCVFKIVYVYASYQHTCAAGAERAIRLRKAPPTRGSWMHGVLGIKNALNARYERKDWESFFDNESEFVIVDNQFGYLKQPLLFLSLPASVTVEAKIHKGLTQSFIFANQAMKKEPLFETASGLLTTMEYNQISEIDANSPKVVRISVFGKNDHGQLGLGHKRNVGKYVLGIDRDRFGWPTHVVNVAVGAFHTLLSTTSGAVYGFGSNKYGELGMQKQCKMLTSPTRVEGLRIGRYHALAAGEHTSFVGTETGLHSAGRTFGGLLGCDTNVERRTTFAPCDGLQGMAVLQVCCGQMHSVALVQHTSSGLGSVWGCGAAPFVQPTKSSGASTDFRFVKFRPAVFDINGADTSGVANITRITCGSDRTLVLDKRDNLWLSFHRSAARAGSNHAKVPFTKVSVPTWRKSERISFIDSQLQKTLAVTTYEPRGVLSVHKSRVARLEDTIGVDGSGVESAHCHSMRTFILAKSGLLYSTEEADGKQSVKSYKPMLFSKRDSSKVQMRVRHPPSCQVSNGCTASHSVILERQPVSIELFRKQRRELHRANSQLLASISTNRRAIRKAATHGAANWVSSRYGQLGSCKSGTCEVLPLASVMPWLQIQCNANEKRVLRFLARVAPSIDDTVFQRSRETVVQAYSNHRKHIRTRAYEITTRGKDVAMIRASSADASWLRLSTQDGWVPLRRAQLQDLCSEFPAMFLKPGVAPQKVTPNHAKSADMTELQFLASQKGMWARYGDKNGHVPEISRSQWYYCPNWKAPKNDQLPQLVGAKCISTQAEDVDKIRHSIDKVKYLRVEREDNHFWDLLSPEQLKDIQHSSPSLFAEREGVDSTSRGTDGGSWCYRSAMSNKLLRVGILLTDDTRSFLASYGGATLSPAASVNTDYSGVQSPGTSTIRSASTLRSLGSQSPAAAATDASAQTDSAKDTLGLNSLGSINDSSDDDDCLDV